MTLFASTIAVAQAPEKMSYQAVFRNTANALVNSEAVGIKINGLECRINTQTIFKKNL